MMNTPLVDIVLPTYNGERYLREQLDSLLKQDYSNIHIYIRDDNSKDNTLVILKEYEYKYSEQITLLCDEKGNLGVTNNVMEILRNTKAPYVMFSDQDDVWFSNKVSIMLKSIRQKEKQDGRIPILVFGDAYVTDDKLNVINESFCFNSGMKPNKVTFQNLLQVNPMIGAACIYNRNLVDIALNLKRNELSRRVSHDWWMAVVAAAFGKIYYRNMQLMLYRQHDRNVVGMHYTASLWDCFFSDEKKKNQFKYKHYLSRNYALCVEMKKNYYTKLNQRDRKILDYYLNNVTNMKEYIRLGLYKEYTLIENLYRFLMSVE